MSKASEWVEKLIAGRVREEFLTAGGMVLFACAAAFVTTFVVFGLFMMMGWVLAVLGIRPPHPTIIAPAVLIIQLVVFYLVKPKDAPSIIVERTADTDELIVAKPHRSQRPSLFYNQEGSGSLRNTAMTILLSTAIAIHEALKHVRGAMETRRINVERVAQLADYLSVQGAKVTYKEIRRDLHGIDLKELLPQVDRLPGFNLIMGEPQGISLTDNAYEAMAG